MTESNLSSTPGVGRNEPCPCGSGKKYKKCHALTDPVLPPRAAAASSEATGALAGGGIPGMPSFDPALMGQLQQGLKRLPKGQMQRLQGLMMQAMQGRDVTRELGDFQRTLPTELQSLFGALGQSVPDSAVDAANAAHDAPSKRSLWKRLLGR